MQKTFRNILFYVSCIVAVSFILPACRVAKNLPQGQSLLVKNKFVLKSEAPLLVRDKIRTDISSIVAQRPNKKFLGFIPFKMWIYYSATHKKKLNKFRQWLINNVGEEPAVYDSTLTDKTVGFLGNYMFNFGFFHAQVSDTVITKNKKTKVVYTINSGPFWKIGTVTYPNNRFLTDSILALTVKNSALKTGERFDIANLKTERDRIDTALRNRGFFYFNREYVTYNLDTANSNHIVNIKVIVSQPSDTTVHEQYRLADFYIIPDYAPEMLTDTMQKFVMTAGDSNEFHIIYNKFILRKKVLADAIAMRRGILYSRGRELRTITRISQLGVFRFINVDFAKSKDVPGNYLDCTIRLSPAKRQSITGTIEANVTNEGLFGTAGSLSYKNKNLTKRADQFIFDVSSGIQLKFSREDKVQIVTANSGVSFTYYLNRFLVPIKTKLTANSNPRTRLHLGYNFEHRYDYNTNTDLAFLYQLHNFNLSFGYEWTEKRVKQHLFNPLNVSFYLIPKRGQLFNERLDANPILKSSFEEQIIIGPNYTFLYNNQLDFKERRYMYFKTTVETAGNIIYSGFKLANLKTENDSQYLIAKRPFAQFFRIEGDWRNSFPLRRHGSFVVRTFAGFGLPYGNSYALPFVKQFFVGGANSLRGFLVREVGPGGYVDTTVYDPEKGEKKGSVGFFNQTGDIKLELNAEFRFDIYRWLKGACFVDAGNVWTMRKDNRTLGNFDLNRFWKEFALDAGVGLRLDFNFFVIRFDYGFPLRDPRKVDGKRWMFEDAQFRRGQFQLALGYGF